MKLPLQVQHQWICDADGRDMLLMDTCSGEDMREIVKRCNAYDTMQDALKEMVDHLISHASLGLNEHEVQMLRRAESALKLTESP